MNETGQLPLDVRLKPQPDLALLVEPEPAVVGPMLQEFLHQGDHGWVYLTGPTGSGKTHCALALNQAGRKNGLNCHYLSSASLNGFAPSVLDQLDGMDVVVLDDIDRLLGERAWEESLFHLFNRLRACGARVMCTGQQNIRRLNFALPDLQSRMAAFVSQNLPSLNDAGKIDALQRRADIMGFRLEPDVAEYLLRRVSRNLSDLIELLDRIDTVLLVTKRRLTIPLVREHLLTGDTADRNGS